MWQKYKVALGILGPQLFYSKGDMFPSVHTILAGVLPSYILPIQFGELKLHIYTKLL